MGPCVGRGRRVVLCGRRWERPESDQRLFWFFLRETDAGERLECFQVLRIDLKGEGEEGIARARGGWVDATDERRRVSDGLMIEGREKGMLAIDRTLDPSIFLPCRDRRGRCCP